MLESFRKELSDAEDCFESYSGRVSILIPAYNEGSYIAETIRGALDQSYKNIEVLVYNDASTDNTADIVSAFQNVKLINGKKNIGAAASMNVLAKHATGNYLCFCSGNDILLPGYVETTIQEIGGNIGMVASIPSFINCGGAVINKSDDLRFNLPVTQNRTREEWCGAFRSGNLFLAGMLILKKTFIDIGGFDENLSVLCDWDFNIRLTKKYNIYVVQEPLYKFRLLNESLSAPVAVNSERTNRETKYVVEKHFKCDYAASLSCGDVVKSELLLRRLYDNGNCMFDIAISYGYILMKLGRVEQAKDIFFNQIISDRCPIDAKFTAASNYIMCCNYTNDKPDHSAYTIYPSIVKRPPFYNHDKIRIGYVTSDTYMHPVGRMLDRILHYSTFNSYTFSCSTKSDLVTKNIMGKSRYIFCGSQGEVGALTSKEMYDKIRAMEIDVLVDCDGHTNGGTRLPLFCKRAAPIQLSMLGYPGDMSEFSCFDTIVLNKNGLIPYFRSLDCNIVERRDDPIVTLGCISSLSKISYEDILYYDQVLSNNKCCRLIYARLGTCYSSDNSEAIMSMHSIANRKRISILNLKNIPYIKIFEICDVIMDHINWSNHVLAMDAMSCGVPILFSPNGFTHTSGLSRDLWSNTCMGINPLRPTHINRHSVTLLSKAIYDRMRRVDTTAAWVKDFELAIKKYIIMGPPSPKQ
jgi:glycosyltransferase involved in cell wall biosynthesis